MRSVADFENLSSSSFRQELKSRGLAGRFEHLLPSGSRVGDVDGAYLHELLLGRSRSVTADKTVLKRQVLRRIDVPAGVADIADARGQTGDLIEIRREGLLLVEDMSEFVVDRLEIPLVQQVHIGRVHIVDGIERNLGSAFGRTQHDLAVVVIGGTADQKNHLVMKSRLPVTSS